MTKQASGARVWEVFVDYDEYVKVIEKSVADQREAELNKVIQIMLFEMETIAMCSEDRAPVVAKEVLANTKSKLKELGIIK